MGHSIIVFGALILTLGCAPRRGAASAPRPSPDQGIDVQSRGEAAAIESILKGVKAAPTGDYKVSSADLLQITVYREEDLSRTARVSQEGMISFPLVRDVKVGGLTVIDAQDLIARKLADFLVSPQVTIFIKEYGNKRISVLGEVQKPGTFELPTESHLTVLEAISMAGGFTPVAAKDRTRVIRPTADGRTENFTIDISAITQQGDKRKDMPLSANDVVYVPQSFF